MKILMVDDEPNILELLKTYLETSGAHQVETAGSGVEALEKIEAEEGYYDCLLLDIQMPGLSGLDLQDALAAAGRAIPTVFITSRIEPQNRARALQAGAIGFLSKPFDREVLMSIFDSIAPDAP